MNSKIKVVLVTGGFDPIHSGHIKYFESAKKLGSLLVVGLNSDEWLIRKKGKPFLPLFERIEIVKNLRMVDEVITWNDEDNSANGAIDSLLKKYPDANIIFANGGDRKKTNIPELEKFKKNRNIKFVFGVGGENKKNSSSWILKNWENYE